MRFLKVLLLLLILSPFISFIWWYYTPKIPLNILILDKTVLTNQANEHRSFNWLLNQNQWVKPDSTPYQIEVDYMGFFPLEKEKFKIKDIVPYTSLQLDSIADTLDILYYTDTYGIYYNEWYKKGDDKEHSKKLYGGLEEADYQLLKRMQERKKLVVTEFNLLASPTARGVRKKTEELLGFSWTGWTGRYFDVLDTLENPEIPQWVIKLYLKQYNNRWPFKKSGIVLVSEREEIVILDGVADLTKNVPMIYTDAYGQDEFDLPLKMHYPFWFDIIQNNDSINTRVSYYQLHTTTIGDSLLKAHRIPSVFPAVIENKVGYKSYYFAGDFADNPIGHTSSYFKHIRWIDRLFYQKYTYDSRLYFFWRFYVPMMERIIQKQVPAVQ